MKLLKRLFREEEGLALIEYGLIAGLVAIGSVLALIALSGSISDIFDTIGAYLEGVEVPPGG